MTPGRRLTTAAVGTAVLVAVALGGCAAPGGGAGTRPDVGRCAAVLPLASGVVHGNGRLIVARPITREDVNTLSREAGVTGQPVPRRTGAPPPPPTDEQGPPLPKACLIVYQGDYPAGSVPGALAPATSGRYALVMAQVRHPKVIRVLVTPALPADTEPRPWWKIF